MRVWLSLLSGFRVSLHAERGGAGVLRLWRLESLAATMLVEYANKNLGNFSVDDEQGRKVRPGVNRTSFGHRSRSSLKFGNSYAKPDKP